MSAAGQFFLKAGAIKLGRVTVSSALRHLGTLVLTPEILVGFALYGLSAILYILLLTRVPLNVAGPAVAIGYVFSVLIGYFLFRENLTTLRLVGLALIACGVILVVWQKP